MIVRAIPDGLQLRDATSDDAATLATFAADLFGATFGHSVPPADLERFLVATYGVERQLAEIEDPQMITRLLVGAGALAGFYQLRRPTTALQLADDGVEIARFYVARAWHGQGVATPLMHAALSNAALVGGRRVWLGVWEENARAIAFYRKSGFETVGRQDFWLGTVLQGDLVMARTLDPS